jgi:hypothetical protein
MHEQDKFTEDTSLTIDKAEGFNRAERRKRLKFYKKEMAFHNKRRPKLKVTTTPEEEIKQLDKARAWATRYLNLSKKIREYETLKEYNKRMEEFDFSQNGSQEREADLEGSLGDMQDLLIPGE